MSDKIKIAITLIVILIAALLPMRPVTAAVAAQPASARVAPIYFLDALDLSRDRGYRAVDWGKVVWPTSGKESLA